MRILKYALKNIKRNAFLSFSSILVLTLIIFFINILILVNFTTDELIKNINSRLSFSLILKNGYTNENSEVIELITSIRGLNKNLSVNYVSPDDALISMKNTNPELTKIVESGGDNPLPASIKIDKINTKQYEEINNIVDKYKNIIIYDDNKFANKLVRYKEQYQKISDIIKVFNSIKLGIYIIISFFIFSVFIIIYNTIGNFIFFHRDEIKITKLVGGDNIFIFGPFSVQGFIYTLTASLISLFSFIYIIKTIDIYIIDNFPIFINTFLNSSYRYFIYELIIISFIGGLSGFLSSIKFISRSK